MKNLIPLILLCSALAASTIAIASPQQTPGDNRPVPRDTPRLAQRLALSHDQLVQFRGINKDRKVQLNAVQADPSLSPRARRQRVKEIHADAEGKIRGMLNQNQLEEYDQIKREHRENALRRRETAPPPPPPPPPQ